MNRFMLSAGRLLARYLSKPIDIHGSAPPSDPLQLQHTLQPGDVLLVEGNTRVSTAIKYLTQSTWSHAALYVGPPGPDEVRPQDHCLVEADTVEGVRTSSLERYAHLHTRICRPRGLSDEERVRLVRSALSQVGYQYDLRNLVDLARYLLPTPPVPTRWRRQLLSLGSGDPTRAICSTLIARAFESIRYPILPMRRQGQVAHADDWGLGHLGLRVFEPMHHTLVTPRDFDVSPYFQIVKPTLEAGFDPHDLEWCGEYVEGDYEEA